MVAGAMGDGGREPAGVLAAQGALWRVVVVALAAAMAVLAMRVSLANASVPAGNLLQNANAETGSCANATSPAVAIPDWSTTSSFTVLCYAAGLSQDSTAGAAIGGGNNYFMGGVDTPTTATQTIDVSAAAGEIDAGSVQANLSGYLGGYFSQGDNMVVTATFLAGPSSTQLGSPLQIGPVTAADRSDLSEMLSRSSVGTLPPGTRSIRVTITATRTDGSDNDAAADNLSLTLTGAPVLGQSVAIAPVSGLVLVKLPKQNVFTQLHAGEQIPLGSTIDATKGMVSLTAAKDRRGHTAIGQFSAGAFRVGQRPVHGTEQTVAWLAGPKPSGCRARTARPARSRPRHRALLVRDPGNFTTYGIYASASDRARSGTRWLTEDTCAGTLIRVAQGKVLVDDFPHHRAFVLQAGHSFLAHPGRGG